MGLQLEHAPSNGTDETRTDSVLDVLRTGFSDTSKGPKHLDLPIPLRDGLGLRFIALDRKTYDDLQQSDDEDTNLDFVAAACECILVKDDGRWRPAVTGDGALVRFDGSLSEITGWETDSPRKEVFKAFGRVPQPYLAIAEHVALVQAWMAGRAEQREEDLLGES